MIRRQTHILRKATVNSQLRTRRIPQAALSSSARRDGYDDTIQNLKIGAHTRVIFQGFTGKQATANAKESLDWGTNVVGGVKPNGSGEHLGKPVLPTVRAAMEQLKPDATGIYVAAHQAAAAIEEAIEAEVPLIVAVAEHIPLHDIMRVSNTSCKQNDDLNSTRYIPFCKASQNRDSWVRMRQESSQPSDDAESDSNLFLHSTQDILAS